MKCAFLKKNNHMCDANAMKDVEFCFLHNPAISEREKKDAQARGGRGNTPALAASLPPVKMEKSKDVLSLLEDTINRIRAREMDIRIANCLGYLSGHCIKALEVSDLEERIAKMEEIVYERGTQSY